MISLDTYYSSSQFKGTSGTSIGREGYVPRAQIGESGNYLRGDGKWIDFGLANLTSTYTTVRSLSDSWEESAFITPLQTASASWNSVYTTTSTNSGKWESNYTSFNTNSAKYDSVYTTTNSNSAFYILSGGNTNNSNFSIGSNDAYNFSLETNNTNRISVLSSGETIFLTTSNLLSTSLPFVEVKGGEAIGTDIISLSSFNTPTGYSPGQLSVNSLLVGQNDLGNYIGRTNVTENIFSLQGIENNFIAKLNTSRGNFNDLSISSDGRYITICNYRNSNLNGVLYTSNNFGSSFTTRTINGDVTKGWLSTAMSTDGKIQVAGSFSSVETGIFVSEDYGETWNLRFTQAAPGAMSVSSDGRIQAAAVGTLGGGGALNGVYMSYDFGKNWVKKLDLPLSFEAIKMSSDGRIITAAVNNDGTFVGGGHIYTSHDFGNTWVQRTSSKRRWTHLAMSADGKNQTIVVSSTTVGGSSLELGAYVSNNYGITWNQTLPQVQASGVCMTSSGKTQFVIRSTSFINDIYISNNYGASWSFFNTAPSTTLLYNKIVCSSDGKVVALARTSFSGIGSSQLDVSYAPIITPNPVTINNTISSSSIIFAAGGNSDSWNSAYTTTNSNSARWQSNYTSFNSNSGKYDSVYTTVNSNSGTGIPTGKTLYVDAGVGTDTRTGLSKYDITKPFLTIAAAVAASGADDLVWVRSGSYTITSTISLNGKGSIQFETGTIVNVAGSITALSASENKTIIGDAFVLSDTAKLVTINGGTLRFEFSNISSTSTGTLFTVTAGTIDTSFASIVATNARAFELSGSGGMRIRRSHSVSCQQFLYANTTGGATIDLWTVVGSSPDTVFYIDNIVGLSYRGVNCNSGAGQNTYTAGYNGAGVWDTNLTLVTTSNSIQLNSTGGGGFGYAINTTQAQITSPSRYSFSSKLKWNASRLVGTPWYGPAGLVLSNANNLGGNYLFIGLQPVLADTWARPSIAFKLGANSGSGIVYTDSTWSGFTTTLNDNGAIRLQNQPTPAVITINKIGRDLLRVVINSPMDGDRIINIKFTTQEAIDAFASFNRFGYAVYVSDWTFSDQVIEGNLAPTIFFNYPQSTAGGGPISEINPVLRNIRISVANPRTPATIFTTNAQRVFYLDNVKIASWDNRLAFDSLVTSTSAVAYDVYSNRPAGSNITMIGDYRTISTIF